MPDSGIILETDACLHAERIALRDVLHRYCLTFVIQASCKGHFSFIGEV